MIPPFLKTGDTIGIAATARWISAEDLQPAITLFESWGLRVVCAANVHTRHFQLAGDDTERAAALQSLLDNPEVKAIIVARGGYGTVRIIDRLDLSPLEKNPKWICGFSDVTVLHLALNNRGIATLHCAMPFTFKNATPQSLETLRKGLLGELEEISFPPSPSFPSLSDACITGGNLSVINSQAGSRTGLHAEGSFLFLEDIDEMMYHIDRMLMAMKRSGGLKNVKGLLIGGFSGMKDNTREFGFSSDNPWGSSAKEMITELATELNIPVYFGLPAGHEDDNRAFYLGRKCSIESTEKELVIRYH